MVHENFTENHEPEYLSDCESPNSPGSSKVSWDFFKNYTNTIFVVILIQSFEVKLEL